MIAVNNVKKSFDGKLALNIEELETGYGESIGVVGNNGAGKTTFFKSILDLIQPDEGEIKIESKNVRKSDQWQSHLNAFIDETFLIDFLKPKEYLSFVLKTKDSPISVEQLLEKYGEFSNTDIDESKKLIRDLSTGTKVRIGVLSLLAGNPKFLILDEPFAHLDPTSQARLRKLIKKLKEEGKTVIVSSHNLHNIAESCERVILIESGEVKHDVQVSESTMKDLHNYFMDDV